MKSRACSRAAARAASKGKPLRAAIALLALCQAHAAGLPAHPRLLLDRADVTRLKARVAQPEWAAARKAFRAGVDAASNATLELPPRAEADGAVTVRAAGRSVTVDTERATVGVAP
jgi:hypothetical protein